MYYFIGYYNYSRWEEKNYHLKFGSHYFIGSLELINIGVYITESFRINKYWNVYILELINIWNIYILELINIGIYILQKV